MAAFVLEENSPQPYVLAEIANAHNGDFGQLIALIEAAQKAGAQGVKFQWFQPDTLAMPDYEWYPVYKTLVFTTDQWLQAVTLANGLRLDVWVDVVDEWALDQIEISRQKIYGLKVPPTALLDRRLTVAAVAFGKPTLIGIGGHSDEVIQQQVNQLRQANSFLILEHGVQAYPTKREDATLRRIPFLKERYGIPVAFADHEAGDSELALHLPEYAYFAGAVLIEKHICLNRSLRPHDYYSSLEPPEFRRMVDNLSQCRAIMGSTEITEAQRRYLTAASRVVLRRAIEAEETVTLQDIMCRRTADVASMTPDVAEGTLPAVAAHSMPSGKPLCLSDCRPHSIVAVVPCRLKSSRLKGKALLPIHGVPSVQRCLLNTMAIKRLSRAVLATSTHPDDSVLEPLAREAGADFLRGSEEDVLERFLTAANLYHADLLLRITGDCPVVSYEIADMLIDSHLETKADVTYCQQPFAVGTACEVYSASALRRLRELVPRTEYSEYLLLYLTNNPQRFKLNPVTLPETYRHAEWRLTLDEQADLDLFNLMFSELQIGHQSIAFHQIVNFFSRKPEAAQINADIQLRYLHDPELVLKLNRATTIPAS